MALFEGAGTVKSCEAGAPRGLFHRAGGRDVAPSGVFWTQGPGGWRGQNPPLSGARRAERT